MSWRAKCSFTVPPRDVSSTHHMTTINQIENMRETHKDLSTWFMNNNKVTIKFIKSVSNKKGINLS